MDNFYLIAVILLALLAVLDLIVGVSNDAVNFLNSAIGSKVSTRRTIMIVASLGILMGAVSSNGMMEVARKGIFNPEYFYFSEIMVIFLAVMLTDILLLDIFNTLGMPTSTTVSIVFELLGAAVFVSVIKLIDNHQDINLMGEYINTGKALVIISGILLSVVIAFSVGALVQYFSRWLFSFDYHRRIKPIGILWCGLAFTFMFYFLIYKGLKATFSEQDGASVHALLANKDLKIIEYTEANRPVININGVPYTLLVKEVDQAVFNHQIKDAKEVDGGKYFVGKKLYETINSQYYETKYITGNLLFYNVTNYINKHFWLILGAFFLIITLSMLLLVSLKINIFKVLVLFGTFCLAMAFSGNDLVNFIGVPIAGLQAWEMWRVSGIAADAFPMTMMQYAVNTPMPLLFGAGIIMILTLWFSKKARTVTETEVNLGRQDEGIERFEPNPIAQNIVRSFRSISTDFLRKIPKRRLVKIERNFKKTNLEEKDVAFDLVRASVNLTVASILIAAASNLKLPLSTTYVSFLVAMGTSLSDRAWDRESAVYRVSGVIHVIGGWFITAFIAFFSAGIFAAFISYFDMWAVAILVLLTIYALYRSSKIHSIREEHKRHKQEETEQDNNIQMLTIQKSIEQSSKYITTITQRIGTCYELALVGLAEESTKKITKSQKQAQALRNDFNTLEDSLVRVIRKTQTEDPVAGRVYIKVFDRLENAITSITLIVNTIQNYVINSHKPLKPAQIKHLMQIQKLVEAYFEELRQLIADHNFSQTDNLQLLRTKIYNQVDEQLNHQVKGIVNKIYGNKNSRLNLTLLLESKGLIEDVDALMILYQKIHQA